MKSVGTQSGYGYLSPKLTPSLYKLAMTLPTTPPPKKERKRLSGGIKRLSDEQVAEIRDRYENHGESPESLSERYGMTLSYMKKILSYEARPLVSRGRTNSVSAN